MLGHRAQIIQQRGALIEQLAYRRHRHQPVVIAQQAGEFGHRGRHGLSVRQVQIERMHRGTHAFGFRQRRGLLAMRVTVEHGQHLDFLAKRMQLGGDRMGDQPAQRPAHQAIGPVRLHCA